jgi:outer membrane protein assembly factor BamB
MSPVGSWRLRVGCALAIGLLGGAARADDRPSNSVYLDVLDGDAAAALADGDAAARAGEWARAAFRYQQLLDRADGAARDRLVELPAAGAPPRRPAEAIYASLPVALRARLAALPPEGLAAYRKLVDAEAAARAAMALRARDPEGLEAVAARWLFSSRGLEVATTLGDLYLEAGDVLGALSTYELGAQVPGGAAALEPRIAAARERVEASDAAAAALREAPGPGLPSAARPDAAGLRPVKSLAEPGDGANLLNCRPIAAPGGVVVVVRPGRAVLLRPSPGAGEAEERALPPDAFPLPASGGPLALGGSATQDVVAVAIERSRFLEGTDPGDAEAAAAARRRRAPAPGGPARPPAAPRPGVETGRGGIFGYAFDLYAFDARRDYRLIFTTAEASAFGPDAAWLPTIEWTATPVVGPGLVFGAATGRSGEPEVFVAGLETSGPPRVRWRTFLCARGYLPPDERGDGAPLQPALARAGGRVLVDSGVGVLAALDAHRGEVLWAVRRPGTLEERRDRTVIRGDSEAQAQLERPTAPPAVFPAGPGGRAVAVFAPRCDGDLIALDVATGEVVWSAAAEGPIVPVALWRGRIAAVEDGALTLVEPGRGGRGLGKRCAPPLPLPGVPGARDGVTLPLVGRGAALGDRIAVPLAGNLLIVRAVDAPGGGFALRPERNLPQPTEGTYDAVAIGDALGVSDAIGISTVADAGPTAVDPTAPAAPTPGADALETEERAPLPPGWDDALSVAEIYGLARDADLLERLRRAAEAPETFAPPPPLSVDEEVERAGDAIRITPGSQGSSRTRVTLVVTPATRSLRVEVEPAPEE